MGRKIPLGISEDHLLDVNAYTVSPIITKPSPVFFYIDTGSSKTILTEIEATKLGIDLEKIKIHPKGLGGFGEGITQAREIDNVCFVLKDENGEAFSVEMEQIIIAMKARRKDARGRKMNLVNVLGSDFFLSSKLGLFVNLSKGIAYLEK